jgi:DNA-binding response OmpR family regulator
VSQPIHTKREQEEMAMSKKVLIIDDEEDVRKYLAFILNKDGYQTAVAANGQEGLEVAKRENPDLISLDLMMPNQSGTDFYRNMIKDKKLAATPIIVVSALAGRHLVVRKPVAVFDKPINADEFLAVVNRVLAD